MFLSRILSIFSVLLHSCHRGGSCSGYKPLHRLSMVISDTRRPLTLLVLFFVVLISFGCSRIVKVPLKEGKIGTEPPGQVFLTEFNTMQLLGDFNGWAIGDLGGTRMTLIDDWTWTKTIYFSAPRNSIWFKFVPDQNWDLAFGTPGDDNGALEGYAEPNQGGTGNHIDSQIPEAGYWTFEFHENNGYYRIFKVSGPGGTIMGIVLFEDLQQPPYPGATVVLIDQGTYEPYAQTSSDTLTGEFQFSSISTGTYMITASAFGYLPDTIFNITVENDTVSGLVLTLSPAPAEYAVPDPPFFSPQVDGDLSDWAEPSVVDTIGDSPWGQDGDLGNLYISHDSTNLYIGLTYSLGQDNNACIIYIHAGTPDTTDGTTDAYNLNWYPRNFQFPPDSAPEFAIARWGHSTDFELRQIFADNSTTPVDPNQYEVVDFLIGGNVLSTEIQIPFEVLYNLSGSYVPPYSSVLIVAVIAGGNNYGGPETVPDNPIPNEAGPIYITNFFMEQIDINGE